MKFKVVLLSGETFELENIKEDYIFEHGYHFVNENQKTILYVPKEQLCYYQKVD